MKEITKWVIPALALLLALPALALSQGRWNGRDWDRNQGYGWSDSRDDAYRAGYNQGYGDGERQGRHDSLEGRRFNDKVRDMDHFSYGFNNSHFRNDFRKGFKKGYREGYREGFHRNRGRRWY